MVDQGTSASFFTLGFFFYSAQAARLAEPVFFGAGVVCGSLANTSPHLFKDAQFLIGAPTRYACTRCVGYLSQPPHPLFANAYIRDYAVTMAAADDVFLPRSFKLLHEYDAAIGKMGGMLGSVVFSV